MVAGRQVVESGFLPEPEPVPRNIMRLPHTLVEYCLH